MSVKLSELTELETQPSTVDKLLITDASAGTSKNITYNNISSNLLVDLLGQSIEDFSDVSSMTPTDGELLVYLSGTWDKQAYPTGTTEFTASGAITAGDRVKLVSANTVSTIASGTDNQDYIGIAEETVADTETVSIWCFPAIADNQTGLTAGQHYFVNTDGSLTTTDTGYRAGKAYSATDLLIKGN